MQEKSGGDKSELCSFIDALLICSVSVLKKLTIVKNIFALSQEGGAP